MEDYHEHKPTSTVKTHLIGDWIIRESSEPFQRKENEQMTLIERINNREKSVTTNEPTTSSSKLPPTVNRWTVCYCFIESLFKLSCILSICKKGLVVILTRRMHERSYIFTYYIE